MGDLYAGLLFFSMSELWLELTEIEEAGPLGDGRFVTERLDHLTDLEVNERVVLVTIGMVISDYLLGFIVSVLCNQPARRFRSSVRPGRS